MGKTKKRTGAPCYQHDSYDPNCSDCYHDDEIAPRREQPQGEATRAQAEGGEKPRDFATNATSATKAALDALAKAEKDEGLSAADLPSHGPSAVRLQRRLWIAGMGLQTLPSLHRVKSSEGAK